MRFEPGQMLSAQWDGDGSWCVLRVMEVIDDSLQVWVYAERFEVLPTTDVLDGLDEDAGKQHPLERDELALMWPAVVEPPPEQPRSTRRGLLENLLKTGVERGEQIARARRRPPWG
jgi:hypothetical protein